MMDTFCCNIFVCFGYGVAFKHLRSYRDDACSSGALTNVLPHRKVMQHTQGMISTHRHSIQTQGRLVVVLSTDVEGHTGIHNYQF